LLPTWMGIKAPRLSAPTHNQTLEEKHSALYQALEKLDAVAQRELDEVKGRRAQPEKDLVNLKQRMSEFRRYILEGFDLKANHELQTKDRNFDELQYRISLHEAISKYVNFFQMKSELKSLIGQKQEMERISFLHEVSFLIDEKGQLHLQMDELLDALNGIEFDRLGECEICERLFWIGRKGIVCCSHRCGNVRNNRLARIVYQGKSTEYKLRKYKEEENRKKRKYKGEADSMRSGK
ncbi:MAG: MICOS complex subunit MIC60, partial [Acidobacteriota bacterium]|nr:MICOS complex subunit MIC60 [Acidobacteriota bacterium]